MIRRAWPWTTREGSGDTAVAVLLNVLPTPAAVCAADGRIFAVNDAWRGAVGKNSRVRNGAGLFHAFQEARRGGQGEGAMAVGTTEWPARVMALDAQRFLVRLLEPPPAPAPPETLHSLAGPDPFAAASPFGAALVEGDDPFTGVILEANESLRRIAGARAVAGASLADLIGVAALDEARAQRAAGRGGPFEVSLTVESERTGELYLTRAGNHWLAYLLDVTDQRQLQLQLAQRNKMEAIGQLAGGVAHDFNNLLTAIQFRTDEMLSRHPLGDPSYESLSEISQTVVRAAGVVGQLLTFSRKTTLQRQNLDLGAAMSNLDVLLRRLLREDVRFETDYGRNLPDVRVDKAQLENAVVNLVVNARDAVTAKGGGTIRLRTARVDRAQALALGYGGPPLDEMALIEVADDGPGIPPESLSRIFEPFFTTKPLGEGTGLGLATVYGAVKQAEGWIGVESPPGKGAVFRIFLPVHSPGLVIPEAAPEVRGDGRDLSGVGRILFVEDEILVRGIAARLLRARGYEVIEAADGEEALKLAEAHAGAIDLMISDVVMPGIDGPTLLKMARPFLGSAPVVFISGYAEAEFSDLLEDETGVSFLPKPLDIKSLSEHVKTALRGG